MVEKSFVGLYISPSRIEAVHYSEGNIKASSYPDLPLGLINSDGEILDPQLLGKHLADFWKLANFIERRVVVGIWGKKVIMRMTKLPKLPVDQLYQTILSEAERYALFREETHLFIDYFAVENELEDVLQVYYAVTSEDFIVNYREVCKYAKLQVMAFDIAQLSAQRGLAYYHPPLETSWTSAVMLPGKLIISHWAQRGLITWREVALTVYEEQQGLIDIDILSENFETEVVRTLLSEERISRDYPLYIVAESEIISSKLAIFLNTRESIPLQAIGEFKMEKESPALKNISLIALGVSLWSYINTIIPAFNLVRFERPGFFEMLTEILQSWVEKQKIYWKTFLFSIIIGLLLMGTTIVGGIAFKINLEQREENIRNQIAQVKIDTQRIEKLVTELKQLENQKIIQFAKSQEANRFAEKFIEKIRSLIPTDSWLNTLIVTETNELQLEGMSVGKNSAVYFANEIMNLKEIKRVKVLEAQKKDKYFNFKIIVTY